MKFKGQKIKREELEKNDLFYMKYGYNTIKFRVLFTSSSSDLVLAHSLKWCYSDSVNIDSSSDIYYIGKMSKFRAFFLL